MNECLRGMRSIDCDCIHCKLMLGSLVLAYCNA
jgi:hypothetical protein